MALCDFVIKQDIQGIDCANPPIKGVESIGAIVNRRDVNYDDIVVAGFELQPNTDLLKCNAVAYKVVQSGKTPFNGTQQEMVEGANANTITNTLQLVVLKQDEDWAEQLFALVNGEFVAFLQNKQGGVQVYGFEAGLHCTGAVRELYNDDTLAGWQITFTEEGAALGNLFLEPNEEITNVIGTHTGAC